MVSYLSDDPDLSGAKHEHDTGQRECLSWSTPLTSEERCVRWLVDSRQLTGRRRVVVSPPFQLPALRGAIFRLMLTPQGVSRHFRKKQVPVAVQLKCETDLSGQNSQQMSFHLAVGDQIELSRSGDLSQCAQHDFTDSAVCAFPSELCPADILEESQTGLVISLFPLPHMAVSETTLGSAASSSPQLSSLSDGMAKLPSSECEPLEPSVYEVGERQQPLASPARFATATPTRVERRALSADDSQLAARSFAQHLEVRWAPDSTRRRSRVLVSPSFQLPVAATLATFKLLLVPASSGKEVKVQVKCEEELPTSAPLRCQLTIGQKAGDVVAHDFQSNPVCAFEQELNLAQSELAVLLTVFL